MPVHGGKLAARALKEAGVEVHLHALGRPHHAALRRLPRRRHPHRSTCATSRPPCTRPTRGRAATRARSASPPSRRAQASPTASPASRTRGARTRPSWCSAARARSRTCAAARSRRWTTSAWSARSRSTATPSTRPSASPSTSSSRSATRFRAFPGPAYLEIPMDVFMGQVRVGATRRCRASARTPPRLSPDRAEVRAALELLAEREAADGDGRHVGEVVARERAS